MSNTAMPQEVLDAIHKLDDTDQDAITAYIDKLKAAIDEKEAELSTLQDNQNKQQQQQEQTEPMETDEVGEDAQEEEEEDDATADDDFPPLYESGEDYDGATEHKQRAAEYKAEGKWQEALDEYTAAIQAAPPSALLYANRAMALLRLQRYRAAERDCNEALTDNPDSAKALRVRGKARKALGEWNSSLRDLSASQTIDYDEDTVMDLKDVSDKVREIEHKKVEEKLEKEAKLRKRAEEIKRAQEEAKQEKEEEEASQQQPRSSGMPGGGAGMSGGAGMPGGMPAGMGGIMEMLQNDPELVAAMQNPKVVTAMSELMSGGAPDPAKMQSLMADPEVGPVLQKFMTKIGGAMGGAGGMPGPGGFGGSTAAAGGTNDDEIPNIDGDDDLDELPDLE